MHSLATDVHATSFQILVLFALTAAATADNSQTTYGPSLPGGQTTTSQSGTRSVSQSVSRSDSGGYGSVPDYSYKYSVPDQYSGDDTNSLRSRLGYRAGGSFGNELLDRRVQRGNYYVNGYSDFQNDDQYYDEALNPRIPATYYSHDSYFNGNSFANRGGFIRRGGFQNRGFQPIGVPNFHGFNFGFGNVGFGGLNDLDLFRRPGGYGFNRPSNFGFSELGFRGGVDTFLDSNPGRMPRGLYRRPQFQPNLRSNYF